jgi:hypothetical protein
MMTISAGTGRIPVSWARPPATRRPASRDAERRLAHLFAVTGAAEERDADRHDGPQQMRRAEQVPMGDREGEADAQLPRDAASEALS